MEAGKLSLKVFWIQARTMAAANLKTRYRNTVAGFLWVVLNPLLLFITQAYVFHGILKLNVDRYNLFLLSGLLPWVFITMSIDMTTSLFVVSGRLLKSFPVHPIVFLSSQIVDNLINFVAAFVIILIPTIYWERTNWFGFLLLPIPIVILVISIFGMTLIFAITQVFFRDTRFIVSFGMNIVYFITPIFYPTALVPQKYRWVVTLNPFNYLLDPFRTSIYEYNWNAFVQSSIKAACFGVTVLVVGVIYWSRKRNEVYHYL